VFSLPLHLMRQPDALLSPGAQVEESYSTAEVFSTKAGDGVSFESCNITCQWNTLTSRCSDYLDEQAARDVVKPYISHGVLQYDLFLRLSASRGCQDEYGAKCRRFDTDFA
jgi:hypothetical protein